MFAALEDALALLMARTSETSANAEGDPNLAVLITEALRLASIPTPRPLELERAEWVLRHPRVLKTFIEHCTSPDWYDWLRDTKRLRPVDSQQLEDGTLYAVPWPQANYLRLMAQQIPEAVQKFLATLSTDNWIALRQLPSILKELPSAQFWQLSNQFEQWMATRGFHLEGLLEVISDRLDTDEDASRAVSLLPAIATQMNEADPRNELPRVRELATAVFVAVSQTDAARIVALLLGEVEAESLSKWEAPDRDYSHIARKDIERPNRESRIEYVDWLSTTLVTVLEAIRGRDQHLEALGELLVSPWSLAQRAAIYELSQDSDARVSLGSVLSPRLSDFMFGRAAFRETALLVTQLDSADPLRELAQRLVDAAGDGSRAKRWRRALAGERDDLEFHEFGETEVVHVQSALTAEELAARFPNATDQELIEVVMAPEEHGIEISWHQSGELLWDSLATLSIQQDRRGIISALTIKAVDEHPDASRLIRKAPDLLAQASDDDWAATCETLLELGTLPNVQWAVLDALREITTIAPRAAIDRIREYALDLTYTNLTPLDEPLEYGTVRSSEPPDILVRQLNDIPGKACELLFGVFIRERQSSNDSFELPEWLRSFVEQSARVDGVEVRVLVGELFPFVVASDPKLAHQSLPGLLPRSGAEFDSLARQAFWSGYAYKSRPHSPTLELLAEDLLSDIPSVTAFDHIDRQIRNALVEHAIVGWANDVTGFESLPRLALIESTEEVRKHFLWAVGRFAANDKERPDLWKGKIKDIVNADQTPQTARSRDGYEPWMQFIPELLLDTDLRGVLVHVVSRLTVESAYQFFNFVEANQDHDPQLMFGLFEEFVLGNMDAPQMGWYRDQFAAGLKALAPVAPPAALNKVVNRALGQSLLTDEETRELLRIS